MQLCLAITVLGIVADRAPPTRKALTEDGAGHVACIHSELDATVIAEPGEVSSALRGHVSWDQFLLFQPDVDKTLESVHPTTCKLDPCPSWLIRSGRGGSGGWSMPPSVREWCLLP